ncbi:hypothetical protein HPP92_002254 [Vanilla planifolia]|uniref:Uncharacterized protein n=1 Tax=Vanilla planifolia TaxID=51239 RepID=A0A835SDF9_VANPL|nr:hypothetical protein HPP92_002254 [Vanilla planifolia]
MVGIYIPIANVRDDVVAAYKKEIDWHTNAMLKSYEHLFYKRKVEMITTVIEADDVSDALSNHVFQIKNQQICCVGYSSKCILQESQGK